MGHGPGWSESVMHHPRLLVGLLVGVATVAVAAYLGAAVLVYDNVSRVEADCGGRWVGNTPASWSPPAWASERDVPFDAESLFVTDHRDVRIPRRDPEIDLHAWWLPSPDGPDAPAVIVVHGLGGCVRDPASLAPSAMLNGFGYAVLAIDLRDHGSSTIEDGRYAGGTEEFRDVMGAVDWLVAQAVEPGRVGVLGTSMGAATAIIAAGQDDRIAAVWSDSGYFDMERRIAHELEAKGYPALLAPASTLVARFVSGDDLASHTVSGELASLQGRHLFVVHGASDESTYVSHAHELEDAARSAGVSVDSWIVPEAGHVGAMFLVPVEYEERLGEFFGSAFE